MELRHLEYAVAVVDHGGFTRAARAVHIAQPSLSQAIRRLENELGVALFVRHGRSVHLSEAGEAFIGPARAVLRDVAAVRAAVAAHAGLETGTLDVASLGTLVADPLAPMIARLRRAHPGVVVRVAEYATIAESLDMVLDGRAEIGLTDETVTHDGLTVRRLGRQELLAVFPPDSEPAPPARVSARALAARPLVISPPGTSIREYVEKFVGERGDVLDIAVETNQREAVIPLVLQGAGTTVLPAPLAEQARERGALTARLSPPLVRSIALVHRAHDISPAARAFVDLARR